MMKSSLLNTNNGVVFAPCCCDSGAKFSGVPNCGKYRKVLEGAITEVIIHRKCTNSTSPLFSETFWKHFSQIEHFSTNFSFVIYATNKHVLFTLSSKSLRFRKKSLSASLLYSRTIEWQSGYQNNADYLNLNEQYVIYHFDP